MFGFLKRLTAPAAPDAVRLRERDVHCHAIWGVDDGSRDREESLGILRLLQREGVKTVVCTSHMYPDKYDNRPDGLQRAFGELERARVEAGLAIELELGAEHYLDDGLFARVQARQVIAFGSERYVLFETHTGEHVPRHLMAVVHALSDGGYTPLLAHVERYHWLRSEDGDELCEDLRAAGAKFQVNRTIGKVNVPGVGTRGKFIAKLLANGWVDEVGSDLHRATADGRPG
ncbi:MAG TPA: CpsB/CapC family capsule biosynthesis tyrosine phosphatase [Nannocystaceae bacterium]|nr:CpsB/CapC family capsule biosynthesis tyrosine phosphatase [Nannocystaceae bacterium]